MLVRRRSCGPDTLHYTARTERLKQAKAEAEKEIKSFRQQQEEKYQKAISEVGLPSRSATQCCGWSLS